MIDFTNLYEPEPELIEVELKGITLTFQRPRGFDEFAKLGAKAKKLAEVYMTPAACVGQLAGLALEDEMSAIAAVYIAECSVSPKMEHADALRLCKHAPGAFAQLVSKVYMPIATYGGEQQARVIEDQKKPCEKTECEDCSCEPHETATGDTPTN